MRSTAILLAALICVSLASCANTAPRPTRSGPQPGPALQVLLVGNSLTYYNNLPALVGAVYASAAPRGARMETEMLAQGGLSIRQHLKAGHLQQILGARRFDVVVLQERGGLPLCAQSADCDDCSFYPECLDSPVAIREAIALSTASGARVVLYGTWSSIPERQPALSAALRQIAADTGAGFADVGAAMQQFAYHANMPIVWDATVHPTQIGSWLAAMLLVRVIAAGPLPDMPPMQTCAPDWTRQRPSGEALASVQPQPAARCFAIDKRDFEQLRLAVRREAGDRPRDSGKQRRDQ